MKHNKPNFRSKFRIYRSIEALQRGVFLDLWHLNGQKPWELCGRSEGETKIFRAMERTKKSCDSAEWITTISSLCVHVYEVANA